MPWFKVDDAFHSHPKAMAAGPTALGLWVIAGSWSSANLQGGFVPDHVLPRLTEDATQLARRLVAAGLWTRTRGGYQFHDWEVMNPSQTEAKTAQGKRATSGRLGNHRRWHESRGVVDPECLYCSRT